jgi:hypothetical protein
MRTSDPLRLGALLLSLAGCIPFPFASPPSVVQFGPAYQRTTPPEQTTGGVTIGQLRVGAHPMGLFRDMDQRPVDVGAGFLLDADPHNTRGGYLDLGAFPLVTHLDEIPFRLALHGQGRLVFDPILNRWGEGGAAQLTTEIYSYQDGTFATQGEGGGFYGWALGEFGVGLYLEGAYNWVPARPYWTVSGGVQLRLPVSAGVGYVYALALL